MVKSLDVKGTYCLSAREDSAEKYQILIKGNGERERKRENIRLESVPRSYGPNRHFQLECDMKSSRPIADAVRWSYLLKLYESRESSDFTSRTSRSSLVWTGELNYDFPAQGSWTTDCAVANLIAELFGLNNTFSKWPRHGLVKLQI